MRMAEMEGVESCQCIGSQQPDTQVLILTMHESQEYCLQALRVGAAGYLVKKAAPSDLQNAVRAVAHGDAVLYPGLANALVQAYLAQPFGAPSSPSPHPHEPQGSSVAHAL